MALPHGFATDRCCPDCLSHILEDGTCDCPGEQPHWVELRGREIDAWQAAIDALPGVGHEFAPVCSSLATPQPGAEEDVHGADDTQ